MKRLAPIILLVLIVALLFWQQRRPPAVLANGALAPASQVSHCAISSTPLPAFLPSEACDTLSLIAQQGPFPNREDGQVFGNYENLLPTQPRGYYHEYTVATPGAANRGTRRIITGGTPPTQFYYTADHYRSFQRFQATL